MESKKESVISISEPTQKPLQEDPTKTITCCQRNYVIPIKYICLFILVLQTSSNILGLRYSRTIPTPNGMKYLASTTVLCSEVVKLVICYMILLHQESYNFRIVNRAVQEQLIEKWDDTLKVSVPAFLFVVQNNLLFLALTELDAVIYQVTYQLKIVTTAIFSVVMLGRSLSSAKWVSLFILFAGICMVQMPADASSPSDLMSFKNIKEKPGKLVGLIAVLAACVTSGFSGVYFEKILKGSPVSVWMRNIQLATCSICISAVSILWRDFEVITKDGFFRGYSGITIFVIFSQSVGGLVVAAVVKYADNILKGFAMALSIIVSSVLSYYMFQDFSPTQYFFIGAALVLFSTYMYGRPSSTKK